MKNYTKNNEIPVKFSYSVLNNTITVVKLWNN